MKLGLKILVSGSLLAAVFAIVPWREMRDAAVALPPQVWGGVLLGFLAGHALGIDKWRRFVNIGRAGLRSVDATLCYSAGLFANLCLPSIVGGDLLRMGLAGRITRRPEAALWGGVMDRLTDTIALILLAAVGGVLARQQLTGWASTLLNASLVVGLGIVGLAVPAAARRPLERWPRKVRRPIGRSLVAFRRLGRQPAVAAAGLAKSLTIQGGFVLLNAWMGTHLGITVPLAVWLLTWPLAKIASLIPISLGGLAVREASLAAAMLPFGVPAARAIAASLLWQTVLIASGLLGGLVWLVLSRWRHLPMALGPTPPAASVTK
ncbi:MAG: YbhN family protein [Gemmatimonadales bacterium]